jgi:hypothetical protein
MADQNLNFLNAVVATLRGDTGAGSLVTLTGHASGKIRIARDKPIVKAATPFLGVLALETVPVSDDGPSQIMQSLVQFRCYSTSELTAIRLSDRMSHLLHARDEQSVSGQTNRGYYDFSDSNVSNRQTRWKSTSFPDHDSDVDVWTVTVEASVLWVDNPCP